MPQTIEIKNQQKRIPLNPHQISLIVKKILKHEGVTNATLSIAFVTDQKIKFLNSKYLQHHYATDVLAFDLGDDTGASSLEGEIIISTVTACRQAKQFQTTPFGEVVLYLIHGILHLLGYDDRSESQKQRMRRQEHTIMKNLFGEKGPVPVKA